MIMTSRQISEQIGVSYGTIKMYLDRAEFARYKKSQNYYDNGEFVCDKILEIINSRRSSKYYKLNLLIENINSIYNVKDIMSLLNITEGYSLILINKIILKFKIIKKKNSNTETKIRQIKYELKKLHNNKTKR